MKNKLSAEWNRLDELELKLKDISNKVLFKAKIDINDKKKIAQTFNILFQKYGLNPAEIFDIIKKEGKRKPIFWFE